MPEHNHAYPQPVSDEEWAEYEDALWEEWAEPCHECDGTGTVPLGSGADLEMDCSACGGLGYQ